MTRPRPKINSENAAGVHEAVSLGRRVKLGHLLSDPRHSDQQLACIPLLLARGNETLLTPEEDTLLQPNDQILFCGSQEIASSS